MYGVFLILSLFPLSILQVIAELLVIVLFPLMSRTRFYTRSNLAQAKLPHGLYAVWRSVSSQAKLILETPFAWFRQEYQIMRTVASIHGEELLKDAIKEHRPIILIAPHLGNYEIAGRAISYYFKLSITALFRPPKKGWLAPIMHQGRARGLGHVAPANTQGVRLLLKALQRHEAVFILPDQVPSQGESGEWVPWFHQPAYTMTLLCKLMRQQKDAACFTVCALRCGWGRFSLHISPYSLPSDPSQDLLQLHQELQNMIMMAPNQYLWSYNRYKTP
jgi:KDO2-lipid IV(A) lauroyltransferase